MDIFSNSLGTTNSGYNMEIVKIVGLAPTAIKIALLLMEFFYLFFAFLLIRRLKIMNTNFKTPLAPTFSFLALINLAASLVITTITLLTLIK